jgi:hypothetical protein
MQRKEYFVDLLSLMAREEEETEEAPDEEAFFGEELPGRDKPESGGGEDKSNEEEPGEDKGDEEEPGEDKGDEEEPGEDMFEFLDADGNPFKPEEPVGFKLVDEDGTVLKEGTIQDSSKISLKGIESRKFSVIVESYDISDAKGFDLIEREGQEDDNRADDENGLSDREPEGGKAGTEQAQGGLIEILDAYGEPAKAGVHYEIIGEDGSVLQEGDIGDSNLINLKDIGTKTFSVILDSLDDFGDTGREDGVITEDEEGEESDSGDQDS